ncbi:MAG: FapA family protein [Planctomycetota bacterium]
MGHAADKSIRVSVAQNATEADILIPSGCDASALNIDAAVSTVVAAGVAITDEVRERIQEILDEYLNDPEADAAGVIAQSKPPAHPANGFVEWTLPEPDEGEETEGTPEADAEASHYERTAFTFVEKGDVLGIVHPPEEGEDGIDVRGQAIAAKQPKEARLLVDDSITIRSDGEIVANADGVLCRCEDNARICASLEVSENVDFSTGNIDFDGSVVIKRGIKDLFVVRATSDVQVQGLVEAATIEAGVNVELNGGMAGRERGTVTAGGNLDAKYIDSSTVQVMNQLSVRKEMMNCHTTVHGSLDASSGVIMGGHHVVAGVAHVGTLGSRSGTKTTIVLGSVPLVDSKLKRVVELAGWIREQDGSDRDELEYLNSIKTSMTPAQVERQMELSIALQETDKKLEVAQQTVTEITDKVKKLRTVELIVTRMLHANTVIVIQDHAFTVRDDERGPIEIYTDSANKPRIRRGDGPGSPLTTICDLQAFVA